MPEPSLSEVANINIDPQLGGGESTPVIDNTKIVDDLNRNARYNAENTWRKYQQFLQNKTDLFKNISDIQGLATAPEDSEVLHKQAGDILGEILKNPTVATGGKGYAELQAKISKFKGDAILSKQNKLDNDTDKMFLARNPELTTPENTAAIENYFKPGLGFRKSITLKMPTIFDEKTAVEGLIKQASKEFVEVVGKDGKPGEGYIMKGIDVDPKAIKGGWNMIVRGGQQDKNAHDLAQAVQERYNKLPERDKAKYEESGGIEKFWADKGEQYLKAYFPDGKYRVIKDIDADPNYLDKERLGLQERQFKEDQKNNAALRAQGWARINMEKDKINEAGVEAESTAFNVISQAAGVLNNAEERTVVNDKGEKKTLLYISDPLLTQKFANLDGKVMNQADFIIFDPETNQPMLAYLSKADKLAMENDPKTGKPKKTSGFRFETVVPLDQRLWLSVIADTKEKGVGIGKVNVLIDKVLKANNNSIYEISQKLKNNNQQHAAPTETPKTKKVGNKTFVLPQ